MVVYQKGEKIVDLYGYAPEAEGYDGDTLQCVFSSGKNAEAIAVAMLVDKGRLRYDDLVMEHWPEFGTNGKETITIADVMRHSGGVPMVVDAERNYPNTLIPIVQDDVFGGIERLEHKLASSGRFPPPSASSGLMYHAHTRGWLVNAIVRRVDPSGRSLGRFLREEVTELLSKATGQEITFLDGIPIDEQDNYTFANFSLGSLVYNGAVEVLPALAGFGDRCTSELAKLVVRKDARRSLLESVAWDSNPLSSFYFPDTPKGRTMEYSSVGMMANARSMAVVSAAATAGDGSFGGVRLLSPEGVANSLGGIVTGADYASEIAMSLSRGGYGSFNDMLKDIGSHRTRVFHPDDPAAYKNLMGWFGVSGSQNLVDREKELAIAYCNTAFGFNLLGGPRSRRILLELQAATAEE